MPTRQNGQSACGRETKPKEGVSIPPRTISVRWNGHDGIKLDVAGNPHNWFGACVEIRTMHSYRVKKNERKQIYKRCAENFANWGPA
jgi:hypothetical protein